MNTFTCDPADFSLDDTLASGQAFRWRRDARGWWTGVLRARVIRLRQDGARLIYSATGPGDAPEILRDFLQLDTDLGAIKRELVARDPALVGPIGHAPGLRLLRQDPEECLLSFVCSTANTVPRIAAGIARLSRLVGAPLAAAEEEPYHAFPTVAALAAADPARIAATTGLGYRAARLVRVARQVAARPPGWLPGLRARPYAEAHAALCALDGVGPKIADCVCLFSLDHTAAVPVDTHIRQVAQVLGYLPAPAPPPGSRRAGPAGLTAAAYRRVGDEFRRRYGALAGYAQNWLFYDHFRGYWGGHSPLLRVRSEE
jgi:N-glycosylase/DNA lyase